MAALYFVGLPCLLMVSCVWGTADIDVKCPISLETPEIPTCKHYLMETGAKRYNPPTYVADNHHVRCADVMRQHCGSTIYLKTKEIDGKKMVKMRLVYKSKHVQWPRRYYLNMKPVQDKDEDGCPMSATTTVECPVWFSNTGAQLVDSQMNIATAHNLACMELVQKNCGANDIYDIISTRIIYEDFCQFLKHV